MPETSPYPDESRTEFLGRMRRQGLATMGPTKGTPEKILEKADPFIEGLLMMSSMMVPGALGVKALTAALRRASLKKAGIVEGELLRQGTKAFDRSQAAFNRAKPVYPAGHPATGGILGSLMGRANHPLLGWEGSKAADALAKAAASRAARLGFLKPGR